MSGARRRFRTKKLSVVLGVSLLASCFVYAQLPGSDSTLPRLKPGDLPPPQLGQPAPRAQAPKETPQDPAARNPAAAGDNYDSDPNRIVVTTRTVLVPTTVKDKDSGDYINGLSTRDFHVFDNDREQKISSDFSYEPLSVAVVIQSNADVEPVLPKLKKVGVLMHGLVTGEGGDMMVMRYDHRINVMQDWTSDPDRIDDALQKLTAGSSTARTIDAVLEADRLLKRHDPQNRRRRVIVLFSFGYDKGSESKANETLRQMQFDNVVVYPIDISEIMMLAKGEDKHPRPVMGGIPPEAMHSPTGSTTTPTQVLQNHPGGNVLNIAPPVWRSIKDLFKAPPDRAFAGLTGGRIYTFARQGSLETAMADLGKELHSQYLLSYSPDEDTQRTPGFHKIRVDVDHPRLDVRTRTGYYWGGGEQ